MRDRSRDEFLSLLAVGKRRVGAIDEWESEREFAGRRPFLRLARVAAAPAGRRRVGVHVHEQPDRPGGHCYTGSPTPLAG
ncbi:MAG TPA: hypothetical protein VEK09_01865 [Jatrophihabitantaceae bacterium]|nr:hypothetical protein [Jatrophihabitantaceae bacterium]